MRHIFACRDAPVDAADIVTGLVLAYLSEIDPSALLFRELQTSLSPGGSFCSQRFLGFGSKA
jgi:hypothetical protein